VNAEEVPDIAAQTQAARDLFARWENGDATEQDLAGGLRGLLDALSSPPADDVREEPDLPNGNAPVGDLPAFLSRRILETDALAVAVEAAVPNDISGWRFRYSERIASSIRAAFEVRLRGTVTDRGEWVCATCGGSALYHSLTGSTCIWEPTWRGTVTEPTDAEVSALRQFAAELTAPGFASLFRWAAPARAWMLSKAEALEAAREARS